MCVIERDGKVVIIDQATEIERLNAVIDSCHEDLNCKSDRIDELEACLDEAEALIKKNADQINALLAQVVALRGIAAELKAKEIYPYRMPTWEHLPEEDTWTDDKLFGKSKQVGKSTYRYHARDQLAKEHPEAFR